MTLVLRNESETMELGARLFRSMSQPLWIYLYGDLGAGKTTLVRGFLRAGGYSGSVKSPTFTLVEEYQFPEWRLVHFDLYRLTDPEELEWIGVRDYFEGHCVCFVEWPDRGNGFLPQPDLFIYLTIDEDRRSAYLEPKSSAGCKIAERMS